MYVHICRAGASSPSSRARCHAERHSAFWRSRDGAGACARSLTLTPVLAAAWRAQRLFACSGIKKKHISWCHGKMV